MFELLRLNTKLVIYSLQMIICSGVDVKVSDEASEDVLVFVVTVDLDLGVVVAEGSERGDQPVEGICVLISSTVLAWAA